jgi:hypothetical protein
MHKSRLQVIALYQLKCYRGIIVLSNDNVTEGTMSPEERMTIDEQRKYLHKMRIRYWQAKQRSERSRLLDEMQAVTELHRKSLLRLINGELARKPRRKQRGKAYGAEVRAAVRVIAQSLDYPCAERLQPNLVWMANHLVHHAELESNEEVEQQLSQVSVSTLRRMLGPVGTAPDRIAHQKSRPDEAKRVFQGVPMRRIDWDEPQPGHFEVDLVHHGGVSAEGQYIHTLQLIDVATGWSECAAILGRSFLAMEDGFAAILDRLPFPVVEFHPDNGTEFFNHYLLKCWNEQVKGLKLSRSRPRHKNDNRFVEENNFSLVRAYVGYQRLDTLAQIKLLHQLYDQLWLYHNLFQPVMRLKAKIHSPGQTHSQRQYDLAQPPLDRLCSKGVLETHTQNRLLALRNATNPCQVRRSIEHLTSQLFHLPPAKPGITEDVHQSLGLWRPHLFSLDQEHLHHVR